MSLDTGTDATVRAVAQVPTSAGPARPATGTDPPQDLSVLHAETGGELVEELRWRLGGPLIANSGFASRPEAISLIEDAHAEAVAVGRPVIANPDLVERWADEHPEERAQPHLSYAAGAEGYNDYPTLGQVG